MLIPKFLSNSKILFKDFEIMWKNWKQFNDVRFKGYRKWFQQPLINCCCKHLVVCQIFQEFLFEYVLLLNTHSSCIVPTISPKSEILFRLTLRKLLDQGIFLQNSPEVKQVLVFFSLSHYSGISRLILNADKETLIHEKYPRYQLSNFRPIFLCQKLPKFYR